MKNNEIFVKHLTQYYETDQMGVIHHANYVKWMEEARRELFNYLDIDIQGIEVKGVYLAVISQSVNYKRPVKYNETIKIVCKIVGLTSTKIDFSYDFYDANDNCCAIGKTSHCFVDNDFSIVVLKKYFNKEYTALKKEYDNK